MFSMREREWIVYTARHTAMVRALGTCINPILEGPDVSMRLVTEGLQFEEALAAAISGTRAIRNEPLAGRWQNLCQAGALKDPSGSYRRVCLAEDIPYWRINLDTDNDTVTAIMAGTMLEAGVTHDDRTISGPLVFWWEEPGDRDFISPQRPGVARAALAAALYDASEVFQPRATVPPGVVETLEHLLGHAASLRAGLEENATLLTAAAERCKRFLSVGQRDVETIMHHGHLPTVPHSTNHD